MCVCAPLFSLGEFGLIRIPTKQYTPDILNMRLATKNLVCRALFSVKYHHLPVLYCGCWKGVSVTDSEKSIHSIDKKQGRATVHFRMYDRLMLYPPFWWVPYISAGEGAPIVAQFKVESSSLRNLGTVPTKTMMNPKYGCGSIPKNNIFSGYKTMDIRNCQRIWCSPHMSDDFTRITYTQQGSLAPNQIGPLHPHSFFRVFYTQEIHRYDPFDGFLGFTEEVHRYGPFRVSWLRTESTQVRPL